MKYFSKVYYCTPPQDPKVCDTSVALSSEACILVVLLQVITKN